MATSKFGERIGLAAGPAMFARQGPLTRELALEPGKFGLGLLPAPLQPEAVVGSVCGFCSTGCNLNIHLRDGVALGVRTDDDALLSGRGERKA